MSIALDTGGGGARLGHSAAALRPFYAEPPPAVEACSSSSSSSVGRDSDASAEAIEGSERGDEEEVESRDKGPLVSVDSLEEALPTRRGISNFYAGRSKSFTSLAEAVSSSSSAKDIAKPENPYSRKRKSLLAFSIMYDTTQGGNSRSLDGSHSKRPANSSWNSPSSSITATSGANRARIDDHVSTQLLPPRCPHGVSIVVAASMASPLSFSPPTKPFSSLRSFSLTDLLGDVSSNASNHQRYKHNRNQ